MSLRIGGLASGMDIDSLVAKLMTAERIPLDKLTQKKQILEWQRDDYRSMNTLLYDLKNFIGVTQTDGVGRKSTFTKKIVTSSNESAVSAKNINSTVDITSTIGVKQLAEAASMYSKQDIRLSTNFDPNNKLDAEISAGNIRSFTDTTFTIQVIQADGTLSPVTSTNTFTVDTANQSLNDVIAEINKRNIGVSAFYDSMTGRVSLVANHTGDVAGQPEIVLSGDFLTSSLQLDADNVQAANNTVGNLGKNAVFVINGMETYRNSNTFQINGYEYTLKQVTDSNGDGIISSNETVTISSKTDTDAIFDSIKKFVDKYNETIDKINSKISEKRYRDYPPLTDAQKNEMKDKEIELWEEKAKSGLLYNDNILSSGLNQMRLQIYDSVDGLTSTFYDSAKNADITINQLANIGITTSSNYLDKGKLVIDEAKLKEAISQNPMAIYELFNKEVKNADGSLNFKQSGIVTRLEEVIGQTIKNIEVKAGKSYYTNNQYTLGRLLDQVNSDITDFEERLKQIEDRYWRQFTAMEQAINQSNQQSMYLMQQFGMGQ
ncbi:flagellar hook-associated protein 2 [Tepidibacillus fermentans]|uniref:Flagellar hook-associated protein 2 n=1 Tax=Tepidibacillus fermentans TaxID=1281767 RepID=A0A4R3KJ64_9BACI|nr:flagellar hook-associated protein 2 [Tepidibacillus fermentans]TCS83305.1 flagellar hook-associated protein 2 [Tepidibacillus fermentans]